jgi:hypothetical protein
MGKGSRTHLPKTLYGSPHQRKLIMNVNLRRILPGVALALFAFCGFAAARPFPQQSVQVHVDSVNEPSIVLDGRTLHLAPGLVVVGTTNMTLVRNQIPTGVYARVLLNSQGDVAKTWVLTPDEVTTPSLWTRMFGGSQLPATAK